MANSLQSLANEYAGVPSDRKRVKTTLPREYLDRPADQPIATFLGLFSIGLGLWEILDPQGVAKRTGTPFPALIRGYGAREIASGVGLLSSKRPAGWLWSRVGGDVLDLSTLAASIAGADGSAERRQRALVAMAAVAGVTVLDLLAATSHSQR